MKVAVLGGGVIGVTSAWYLRERGHEVTVYDRRKAPGLETSFANAGQVSWGYASPWAAPGIPLKALAWLFARHSPLVIRLRADPAMWRWLAAMLANCTASRYHVNKSRMLQLARYSQQCLAALRRETGIAYDDQQRGTLQLFRSSRALDRAALDALVLRRFDVPHRMLDRAQCLMVEPGLRPVAEKIAGGLHLPGDETGDCFKFTQALAALAEARGVEFRLSTPIEALRADRGRIAGIVVDDRLERADAYLVALGSYSPRLLRPLGLRLPVYPVKGYSVTLPVRDAAAAPVSTIMDEAHKVAVTRLGDRIRAAGIAELAGYDTRLRRQAQTVRHVVEDLFPEGGDVAAISYWSGLRAMTPDGVPVIGPTEYPNLFVNTGHGTLGWTMACGSGRVVADLISRHAPEIDAAALAPMRYAA